MGLATIVSLCMPCTGAGLEAAGARVSVLFGLFGIADIFSLAPLFFGLDAAALCAAPVAEPCLAVFDDAFGAGDVLLVVVAWKPVEVWR